MRIRQRTISRTLHLAVGIILAVYVYLPAGSLSDVTRTALMWVGVPVVVLSGSWLWKGAAVRRLLRQRRTAQA